MEAVIIIDVLRRAGADVTVASVEESLQVEMSRKVELVADKFIADVSGQSFDAIALPGGMPGAERLRASAELLEILDEQIRTEKIWSAICASPAVVFESQGWLKGKKATSHPAFSDKLADQSEVPFRVVVDKNLITSRGPGTAFEFALTLVEMLYDKGKADEVAGPMLMYNRDPPKVV
ncbi:hypothetical protein WJX75_008377 [Coccomyxa subellipsoidea]|uniref:DJ-1/PfpI domain-containing protein n=1 Tax=Coccomyxa subellipsoidea TaxID=248742 RepID=A0ABR2YNH9_9CHLO